MGYLFSGKLREVGMANLDLVFRDTLSRAEKTRILRQSCRNFALVALDVIWFSKDTARRVRSLVRFERPLEQVFLKDRGYLCVTGHLGNWEVLGHAASLHGYPMASVATPLKNPEVDRIFRRARELSGQIIIKREGAVRAMLQALRNNGRVAILLDQNTMLTEGGIFVDFFGTPATVSAAGATLALRTGAELQFGFCLPQPDGTYSVHLPGGFEPPPYDRENSEKQIREVTTRITQMYEKVIRQFPECWLWMYKRWKHVRPGDERNRYPFYTSELGPDLIPPSYKYEADES